MQGEDEDRWVRLSVVAARLGCSTETARQLVIEGILRGRQKRRRGLWEVHEPSFNRYLGEIESAPLSSAA